MVEVTEDNIGAKIVAVDNHVVRLYVTDVVVRIMLRGTVSCGNDGKRCLLLRMPQLPGILWRRVSLLGDYIGLNPG